MFCVSNRLGAWQIGEDPNQGNVDFKVFFAKFESSHDPKVASIRVAGDFQSQISPNAD